MVSFHYCKCAIVVKAKNKVPLHHNFVANLVVFFVFVCCERSSLSKWHHLQCGISHCKSGIVCEAEFLTEIVKFALQNILLAITAALLTWAVSSL